MSILLVCGVSGVLGALGIYFRNSASEFKRNTMHLAHATFQAAMTTPVVLRDMTSASITEAQVSAMAYSCLYVYLAYVLFDILFYHKTMNLDAGFHHMFTGVAIVHTLCYSPLSTIEVTYRCLSVEASTIFMCVRPLVKPYKSLKLLNDLLFFASFSLFRVGTLVPLAMFTFSDSGLMSWTSIFMGTNLGLNGYWYRKILQNIQTKFCGVKILVKS